MFRCFKGQAIPRLICTTELEYYYLHDGSFASVNKSLKKVAHSETDYIATKSNTQYCNQAMTVDCP